MDTDIKKKVLRRIQYGMYVLTSKFGEDVGAGTINWLSQCSFNPPMVMVGLKKDSHLLEVVKQVRSFVVNVIGKNQKEMAASFFRPNQPVDMKMNGYSFQYSPAGGLILVDAPAWFECKITDSVDRGDHQVIVAEVTDCGMNPNQDEETILLRDTGWNYGG
jgi:flavin reductase (DIM6/NTAB) family NADH-FMN oxidoreductase RutF